MHRKIKTVADLRTLVQKAPLLSSQLPVLENIDVTFHRYHFVSNQTRIYWGQNFISKQTTLCIVHNWLLLQQFTTSCNMQSLVPIQKAPLYSLILHYIRPGKIDSQFIITALITPNTTASTFIMLIFLQFLTDFLILQIFFKWLSLNLLKMKKIHNEQ